jgi:hypothetical protein
MIPGIKIHAYAYICVSMNRLIHQTSCAYLAIIFLIRMMAMPISLLDYSFNQKYIANNLCENRMNSEIQCAGKCYLSKKLAKSNESQDNQNTKTGTKIISVDYCEHFDNLNFQLNTDILLHNATLQVTVIPDRNVSAVFRPPIV